MASTSDVTSGGSNVPLEGQPEQTPLKQEKPLGERSVSRMSDQEVSPKLRRKIEQPYSPKVSSPLASRHRLSPSGETERSASPAKVGRKLTGERTSSPLQRAIGERSAIDYRVTVETERIVALAKKADNSSGNELTKLFLTSLGHGELATRHDDPQALKWALDAAEKQLKPGTDAHTVFKVAQFLSKQIVEMATLAKQGNKEKIQDMLNAQSPNMRGLNQQAMHFLTMALQKGAPIAIQKTLNEVRRELAVQSIASAGNVELHETIAEALQTALDTHDYRGISDILLAAYDRREDPHALFSELFGNNTNLGAGQVQALMEAFYTHEIVQAFHSDEGIKQLVVVFMQRGMEPAFQRALDQIVRDSPVNSRTIDVIQEALALAIKQYPDRQRIVELTLVFAKATKEAPRATNLLNSYPDKVVLFDKLTQVRPNLKGNLQVKEILSSIVKSIGEMQDIKSTSGILQISQKDLFTQELVKEAVQKYEGEKPPFVTTGATALRSLLAYEYDPSDIAKVKLERKRKGDEYGAETRLNELHLLRLKNMLSTYKASGVLPAVVKDVALREALLAMIEAQAPAIKKQFAELLPSLADPRVEEIKAHLGKNQIDQVLTHLLACQGTPSFARALKLIDLQPAVVQEKVFGFLEESGIALRPRTSAYLRGFREEMLEFQEQNPNQVLLISADGLLEIQQTLCNKGSQVDKLLAVKNFPLVEKMLNPDRTARLAAFKEISSDPTQYDQFVRELTQVAGGHRDVRALLELTDKEVCHRAVSLLDDAERLKELQLASKKLKLTKLPALLNSAPEKRRQLVDSLTDEARAELVQDLDKLMKGEEGVKGLRDGLYLQTGEEKRLRLEKMLGDEALMQTLTPKIKLLLNQRNFPMLREICALGDKECAAKLENMSPREYGMLVREIAAYADMLRLSIWKAGNDYLAADDLHKVEKRTEFVNTLVELLPLFPNTMISLKDMPGFDDKVKEALQAHSLTSPFPSLKQAFITLGMAMPYYP